MDGHGSRLSIPFHWYINNLDEKGNELGGANHRWKVFIGLPNGTAYWQVADSSYINGRYELKMTKEKETVRNDQRKYNEQIRIRPYHVMLMIRQCWDSSFGDLEANRKAIGTV